MHETSKSRSGVLCWLTARHRVGLSHSTTVAQVAGTNFIESEFTQCRVSVAVIRSPVNT